MKQLTIILLFCALGFSQELKVEGDLNNHLSDSLKIFNNSHLFTGFGSIKTQSYKVYPLFI